MNNIAEKIINVVREEIQTLNGKTGTDADKISYADKMAILRQFIRTIEAMDKRGDF